MSTRISKCGYCGETQFTAWYSKSAPRDRHGRIDRDYLDSEPVAYCSEEHRDAADELAAVVQVMGALPVPVGPELKVFRASHDAIVMGLYTTAAEARKHCETEERLSWTKGSTPSFDWIEDEEDGVSELTVWIGGEECTTGYVVTALEVAATYDPDGDE